MNKFKFRVYVAHTPYTGPPVPNSIREWAAFCLDPVPAVQSHTEFGRSVSLFTQHPVFYGFTRDEAIKALTEHIQECLRVVRNYGTTIEEASIEVGFETEAERVFYERAIHSPKGP